MARPSAKSLQQPLVSPPLVPRGLQMGPEAPAPGGRSRRGTAPVPAPELPAVLPPGPHTVRRGPSSLAAVCFSYSRRKVSGSKADPTLLSSGALQGLGQERGRAHRPGALGLSQSQGHCPHLVRATEAFQSRDRRSHNPSPWALPQPRLNHGNKTPRALMSLLTPTLVPQGGEP